MIKKSGIYRIINIKNKRLYIGSSVDLNRRKRDHFYELYKNTHHCIGLQNAYNKYGKDSFIFEIIEYCAKDDLINREQFYIDNTSKLYNSSKKAGSCLGYKFGKQSKETCIKKSKNSTKKRKVDCYYSTGDFIERFNSLTEATNKTKVSQIHIREICIGKRFSRNGYRFKYDSQNELFNYIFNINCPTNPNRLKNKKVETITKIKD